MNVLHGHHPMQFMHKELVVARHWCSTNLVHDYHLWLYLLIAAAILGFILLMIASWGRSTILNKELMYYVRSYGL